MEFCINNVCIMQRDDLPAHIRACAEQGILHMEIRKVSLLQYLRSGGTLAEIRRILEETGVKPACLNALEGITFQDERGAQALRELAEMLFYCCEMIGCRNMELIASFHTPTDDWAEIKAETVRSLRELSDLARPYNVNMALEYMGLPGSSVQTFSQALEIINETARDNVGILLDTWHHYAMRSAPDDILRAKGTQIFVVHVSDCPERAPGTALRRESYFLGSGVIETEKLLDRLHEIGYDGVVSVEAMDPAIHAMPTEAFLQRAKETTLPLLCKYHS